jgi:hypothetical protein
MFIALVTRSRFRTATLSLLVATIAFVPPLVRAMSRGPETSSPIRLNRGFEQPPTKCTIVPPADAPRESVQHLALPIRVERSDTLAGEPHFHSAPSPSPDPLRGPPLRSLS